MKRRDKRRRTAAQVSQRVAGRLQRKLYRAAFLSARRAQHLKPALNHQTRAKLDAIDKKLGFV